MLENILAGKVNTDVSREAEERRIYTAERNITHVRSAVVFFNIILYHFFLDKSLGIPSLAWAITIIASLYTLYVQLAKPYRKYPIFLASYFTAISDCILITLWLLATGGFFSPFYVLWYLSIIAVAFRFSAITTIISSGVYTLCYIVLIYINDNDALYNFTPDILIRNAYILFCGALGTLITKENFSQTQQKIKLEKLSQEVKEANEKLKEQAMLYENMIQAQSELGEGVAIVKNSQIIYANDALCKMYGYERDELLNLKSSMQLVVPEERLIVEDKMIRRLSGENTEGYGETVIERKNGGRIYIGYSSMIFKMAGEKHLFYIIRDITDQKFKDLQLQKKTQDLELQNKELENFAYIASHDLQEPLRKITSFSDRLKKNFAEQIDDEALNYINRMQSAAARMTNLINGLLAFSRISFSGKAFEKVNLEAIIKDVLIDLEIEIEKSEAIIQFDNLPDVRAVPLYMRQLFQNIILNGLKFRKENTQPKINIWGAVNRKEKFCKIYIEDQGIGFDPEQSEYIFQIFQRLHGRTEYPGSGLGLAICRKIAEIHGGEITAHSTPGKGSTFIITLPVQ